MQYEYRAAFLHTILHTTDFLTFVFVFCLKLYTSDKRIVKIFQYEGNCDIFIKIPYNVTNPILNGG
jgi:hypothetical protein